MHSSWILTFSNYFLFFIEIILEYIYTYLSLHVLVIFSFAEIILRWINVKKLDLLRLLHPLFSNMQTKLLYVFKNCIPLFI